MQTSEILPTKKDVELLSANMHDWLANEVFDRDNYLNNLIRKPWGHEYRIYVDNIYDVWKLMIEPGGETSFHCHPRTDTALLCLDGTGLFTTVGQQRLVRKGDYVIIHHGVFHRTKNIGKDNLHVVEVATPHNRFDLVRLQDANHRAGRPYEAVGEPLPSMEHVGETPVALYRPHDIEGRYSFVVEHVDHCRNYPARLFSIRVSLETYLRNAIDIVKGDDRLAYASMRGATVFSMYTSTRQYEDLVLGDRS